MATALLNELIERRGLRDVPLDRDRVIRNRYREVMSILVTMVVAVAAWFIPGQATYLFLLFFASDVPGRIATRRPEHQAEHGPRSALPAPGSPSNPPSPGSWPLSSFWPPERERITVPGRHSS